MTTPLKKIVIVGGGAGGLEMATQLGHKLGRKKKPKLRWSIVTTATCGNHCCTKWRLARLMKASMR
ncbi:NADH dehydrogenase domain protein [Shigella flexneri K-404]|nr:NADH dehydrogenase domain protein [Shigella flexneri K-404]